MSCNTCPRSGTVRKVSLLCCRRMPRIAIISQQRCGSAMRVSGQRLSHTSMIMIVKQRLRPSCMAIDSGLPPSDDPTLLCKFVCSLFEVSWRDRSVVRLDTVRCFLSMIAIFGSHKWTLSALTTHSGFDGGNLVSSRLDSEANR